MLTIAILGGLLGGGFIGGLLVGRKYPSVANTAATVATDAKAAAQTVANDVKK